MPSSPETQLSAPVQRLLQVVLLLAWALPTCAFAAIVLLAPNDVLSGANVLARLCNNVEAMTSAALPPVNLFAHAASTSFPQVARAATVIAIFWWPVALGGTLLGLILEQRRIRQSLADWYTLRQGLVCLLVLPICALAPLGFFALPGDPSFATGLTVASRLGYLFMGSVSIWLSFMSVAAWPFVVLSLFRMPFSRRQRSQKAKP